MSNKPIFQKVGYWNGIKTAKYTACIVLITENKEYPMHWYNAFAGQELQAIEFSQDGQTVVISNHDGSAYSKLTVGMGSPRAGHYSIHDGCPIVRYIPEIEMITVMDRQEIAKTKKTIEDYQKNADPVGFERLQKLMAMMPKMYTKHKIE